MITSLVVTRATPDVAPEAEPVVVEVRGPLARLVLDDGECIDFDRRELLAALADDAAAA